MRIGIISDTHGLLRSEFIQAFKGCELIFHGGDIGKEEIIDKLAEIAPVITVRGNNDKDEWTKKFPNEIWTEVNQKRVYMIHDLKTSQQKFEKGHIDIVISGHSHIYKEEIREAIFYLNPGGAGPKRFGRPATAMILELIDGMVQVEPLID
ncbi:metallophosphoesterase family protein [Cellulosilyticum sp. I15G10I2]|uniref:metallophosphoesterase family protein n=1 Tax=Cellulosilyticum sp. I15G10I2 TaxID=1892843 RepID=UPI00085BEC1C|nr:metallophosphoesterase family protein [Cellulosilyticum sp. I15G10I2]